MVSMPTTRVCPTLDPTELSPPAHSANELVEAYSPLETESPKPKHRNHYMEPRLDLNPTNWD